MWEWVGLRQLDVFIDRDLAINLQLPVERRSHGVDLLDERSPLQQRLEFFAWRKLHGIYVFVDEPLLACFEFFVDQRLGPHLRRRFHRSRRLDPE